ncbi:hypothetical protein [Oceanobacillus polygoni]|uniref:Uncharacterized protein YggT (Ycf19 family) n=1 Tax=Oceanobacillus polygoni TaxID=1235259 RepID=A0A9X1CBA3_9BACI|nr:hypothetical protein [Oceanobacillus polygoni]MBP2076751.1 uncharacterized protein YggT (Ycf19 family) [Oceanobacillus polygoni]
METLPNWFWICYYIFLFLTLFSGVINWVRQVYSPLAAMTIIFALLTPLVGFVYSIGRPEGLNEFQYVMEQFETRDMWSVYIILVHIYFVIWWFLFLDIWKWIKKIPFKKIWESKAIIMDKMKKRSKQTETTTNHEEIEKK